MNQVRYMISDASKMVEVESHVLRYWEEELELPIARNEMGHRYYTEDDIHLLKHIKKLKERGYQLKAIKMDISENGELIPQSAEQTSQVSSQQQTDKMRQFENILSRALGQALRENQEELGKNISSQVTERMTKELNYQFREHEEQEEAHFKKLDENLRSVLSHRKEIAKKEEKKQKMKIKKEKKPRFFTKRKQKPVVKVLEST